MRWHVRDKFRTAAWKLYAEPVPGYVGWGFLLTAVAAWVLTLTVAMPALIAGLCLTEAGFLSAAGTVLVALSELIKWFRGWLAGGGETTWGRRTALRRA